VPTSFKKMYSKTQKVGKWVWIGSYCNNHSCIRSECLLHTHSTILYFSMVCNIFIISLYIFYKWLVACVHFVYHLFSTMLVITLLFIVNTVLWIHMYGFLEHF
jgi:hypothetical protein